MTESAGRKFIREAGRIGQGTWYIDRGDTAASVTALQAGLDAGLRHIDTAEMYGDAEPLVGKAIAGRRDDVFLVSKVLPSNASRHGTLAACERSLRRLNTDRLDCYLLHWRGHIPLEETVAAMERLVSDGKIRSWGVSNFDVDDLEELASIAGAGSIACNQVLYHLRERAIEHEVIPWCEENGVAVVAYSPFGMMTFLSLPAQAAGFLRRLPPTERSHRVRSRWRFSPATVMCLPFRKPRARIMPAIMLVHCNLIYRTTRSRPLMLHFLEAESLQACP